MRTYIFGMLSLVAGCAVDSDLDSHAQDLALPLRPAEIVRCAADACVLTLASDTDQDDVADMDEIALGTSPRDPRSRPPILTELNAIGRHLLPSYQQGLSTVVVLPTVAPNGMPMFGGTTRSRRDMWSRLGLTPPSGFDPSNGLSAVIDLASSIQSTYTHVGVDTIGYHDAGPGIPKDVMRTVQYSVNKGWGIEETQVGPESTNYGGTARFTRFNGSTDTVSWNNNSTGTSISMTSRDSSGNVTGTSKVTTQTDPDGTTTTTRTSTDTRTGDTHSSTVTDHGSTEVSTWESSKQRTNSDGSTTTTKTSGTAVNEGLSETGYHETTVTTTCTSGGDCTSTVDEKGTDPAQPAPDTNDPGTASADVDPDAQLGGVSPEVVRAVLSALGATAHPINSTDSEPSYTLDQRAPSRTSMISLVDDNEIYGGVLIFRGDPRDGTGAGPDYDPTLVPPGPELPTRGGCLKCF